MKNKRLSVVTMLTVAAVFGVALLVLGCGGGTTTTSAAATTTSATAAGPGGSAAAKFEIPLTGAEGVPPIQTAASGTFFLFLEAQPGGGYNISYRIDVSNIVDVTAAHVHLGAKGTNGEVIFPLFTGPQKAGSFTGTLAEGAFDVAGLTGSMAGKTIADLAAVVLAGQTYCNVHTKANPNGEIRGQIIVSAAGAGTTTTAAGGAATTTAPSTGTGY
jgi:CHRD domain